MTPPPTRPAVSPPRAASSSALPSGAAQGGPGQGQGGHVDGQPRRTLRVVRDSGTSPFPEPGQPLDAGLGALVAVNAGPLVPFAAGVLVIAEDTNPDAEVEQHLREAFLEGAQMDGRQSRAAGRSPLGDKVARGISASALVPKPKAGRSSTSQQNVPPVPLRGEVTVGSSSALVVADSQSQLQPRRDTANIPYSTYDMARYRELSAGARANFWAHSGFDKRREMCEELNNLPQGDELVQEARVKFNTEQWGLRPGVVVGSAVVGAGSD